MKNVVFDIPSWLESKWFKAKLPVVRNLRYALNIPNCLQSKIFIKSRPRRCNGAILLWTMFIAMEQIFYEQCSLNILSQLQCTKLCRDGKQCVTRRLNICFLSFCRANPNNNLMMRRLMQIIICVTRRLNIHIFLSFSEQIQTIIWWWDV